MEPCVDNQHLLDLVVEYKKNKNIDNQCSMSDELGEYLIYIIDRLLSRTTWRKYSSEEKEDMKSNALFYAVKYADRFDPNHAIKQNKKPDPYNWFTVIMIGAFLKTRNWDIKYRKFIEKCNKLVSDYKPL